MRKISVPVIFVAILATIGCAGPQADTEDNRAAPSKTYTMEQFMETISIGGNSFNPTEARLLVSSNETGIYNVYELDLASGEAMN